MNNQNLQKQLLEQDQIMPVDQKDLDSLRQLIDDEIKRTNRRGWIIQIPAWIFYALLVGLCMSETLLDTLHIPFIAAWGGLIVLTWIFLIPWLIVTGKKTKANQARIRRLRQFLPEYDQPCEGWILVGRRGQHKVIHWPVALLLILLVTCIIAPGSGFVYYLLCGQFSMLPVYFGGMMSISVLGIGIIRGLKAPLEDLNELKTEPNPFWSKIMKNTSLKTVMAGLLVLVMFIGFGKISMTPLAWADVVNQIRQIRPYQCKQTVYYSGREHISMILKRPNLSQRREERDNGETLIFDLRTCPVRTLILNEETKFAKLLIDHNRGPAKDPDFLQMLARMKETDTERLEVSEINGQKVQAFRTVNEYNDITIWADVQTGLPIKLVVIHSQQDRKIVFEDFNFDVNFDPIIFSTELPDGYQVHEVITGKESDTEVSEEEKLPAAAEGPSAFIPHSCTQIVMHNNKEVKRQKNYYKTLSIRRQEYENGSADIFDLSEGPVRILHLEPNSQKAQLNIHYDMRPARNPDLLAMLAQMRKGNAEKLDTDEIEGVQVEGFHQVDPHNDITIWADVKTGLLVKVEIKYIKRKQMLVFTHFDFATPMDESMFSTVPPEGYDLTEEHIGLKLDMNIVTKEHVKQNATMPVYTLSRALSWTKKPLLSEIDDPAQKNQKLYQVTATGIDGRHVAIGQAQTYLTLRNQIRGGGTKRLELNGFTVWSGGPEKMYSKQSLEAADGMIPPGISEERTGCAIETPEGTILVIGFNGPITDAELKELVEALEFAGGTL